MKHIFIIGLFFAVVAAGFTQNILPNPLFNNTCDTAVKPSMGWDNEVGHPKVVSYCTVTNGYRLPNTVYGTFGNAFGDASAVIHVNRTGSSRRDFISTPFEYPMTVGQEYTICLWYKWTPVSSYADTFGITFSATGQARHKAGSHQDGFAHLWYYSQSTATFPYNGFVRECGTFVADQPYNYLDIGNPNGPNDEARLIQFGDSMAAIYAIDSLTILPSGPTGIEDELDVVQEEVVELYDIYGRRIEKPMKGSLYIRRSTRGDKTVSRAAIAW